MMPQIRDGVSQLKLKRTEMNPILLFLMIVAGGGIGTGLVLLSWRWVPALADLDVDGIAGLLFSLFVCSLGFAGGLSSIKSISISINAKQIHYTESPVLRISFFRPFSLTVSWHEVRAWQLTQHNDVIPNIMLDLGDKGIIELWSTQQTINNKEHTNMNGQTLTMNSLAQWLPTNKMSTDAFTAQNSKRYTAGFLLILLSLVFLGIVIWTLLNGNFSGINTAYLLFISAIATIGLIVSGIKLMKPPFKG